MSNNNIMNINETYNKRLLNLFFNKIIEHIRYFENFRIYKTVCKIKEFF